MAADIKSDVKSQLRAEGEEDFIGLWEVVRSVQDDVPDADAATVRQISLEIVDELLASGDWEAGFPAEDGRSFEAWTLAPGAASERIRGEWEQLGREPNIGEIAWLNLKT